jgi:hypothetical protein
MINKLYYNDLKKALKASFKNGIACYQDNLKNTNYGLIEALWYTMSISLSRPLASHLSV